VFQLHPESHQVSEIARTTGGSSDVFKAAVHVYAAPVRNVHSARNVSDAEANATGA
jgi:hypothetical protein